MERTAECIAEESDDIEGGLSRVWRAGSIILMFVEVSVVSQTSWVNQVRPAMREGRRNGSRRSENY